MFSEDSYSIEESKDWSDDEWYINQDKRALIPNDGYCDRAKYIVEYNCNYLG